MQETEFKEGSYPCYRRRETQDTFVKGGHVIDNRDVVPYNPYLSKRFKCHINVEVVTSLKSVKYLFKYVHKGHDRADLEMKFNNDEIKAHIDARYVGPAEACWRLFGFPLSGLSHHVERLAVHLKDQNSLLFAEGEEREALKKIKESTLEAWFAFNTANPQYRHLLYIDMPQHCVWNKQTSTWTLRKRNAHKTIGRLCAASPQDEERYWLYTLLLHTPGATDWSDLLRVPGQSALAESFQEAARERGLIESEDEHRRAMEEAQLYRMPSQFRIFFANLLLNAPAEIDAGPLWEEFAAGLAEDFAHQKNMPEDVAKDRALEHIQTILETKGKKNSHFKGLPDPKGFKEEVWLDAHVRAEMAFVWEEEQEKAIEMREKMYEAQAQAFDVITEAVRSGRPAIFFVDGPGGSGKSFLFEIYI